MSSVDVNDENRGVYPGGKHSSSNDDIFALDEPTGRPSILRQTENLPNKTVPKGIKVCFQTPRRDPVTKKILSPNKSVKMTSVDECTAAMESLNLDKTKISPQETSKEPDEPKQASSYPDDIMPIKSKGGYQLDFDNLDAINPFGGSNKMVLSPARPVVENPTTDQAESQHTKAENPLEEPAKIESALDETLPFMSSVENSLADVSANISSTESSVVTVVKSPAADSCTATPDVKMSPSADQAKTSGSFVEDVPLPVKGSYNLDFDNIDAINPFQTGGSKILNSPLCERKLLDDNPPPDEPQAEENKPVDMEDVAKVVQEVSVQTEVKPLAVAAIFTNAAKPPAAESQPAVDPSKEGPVRLEFNFDDGNEIKRKPPPKKFGKRPSGEKPKEGKPVSDVKSPKQAAEKPAASDVADVPIPKGSYAFDLDKFDDPNFNPFGTTSSIDNSPKCTKKLSPELMETAIPEQRGKPEEKEVVLSACAGENVPMSDPNAEMITEHKAASDHENQLHPETEQFMQSFPEPSQLFPPAQTQSQTTMLEVNEEFVPGATFMANDFDDQIDYLEQFGSSSFKESALRKQSLYLKFDPLLRESPKKSAGPTAQTHVPRPTAFVSRLETPMAENEATKRSQKDEFKPFDATAPTSPVFKSLVPPFPQPTTAEDAIIEVLKYSQKDMDAAIAKVQAEAKEKEEQWSAKYNKLLGDGQEMRKIIAEFELVIAKMMADQEKEREVAQAKVDEALLEKDKVSNDLDAMERSFSELFKRLEKYKEVIEGYKKNEEILKACAQDYLARIKKEEQRYQTLKAHAEEKIGHANEEIAEVRSKYKAEISALQAQLRREQLKVQSLENSLDQKDKEVKELTVLCDELINKVQKG
ncbi:transforming acidic coiled-coil-containing protein 3 [Mastacembelus armatus]|uniref:transforming acidic coiled-coil-containing protein 3 n=1 Tax=Mastacembelus armatus TaxID=205130 RepID=UPI000E4645A1|nr:transforming acidic coiled-coil-containing protein 3 [Mastacembelus armatus]XP_026157540.1 transforming acidic coiled-coil-containing protein 3 [Mastacembelus armatus]